MFLLDGETVLCFQLGRGGTQLPFFHGGSNMAPVGRAGRPVQNRQTCAGNWTEGRGLGGSPPREGHPWQRAAGDFRENGREQRSHLNEPRVGTPLAFVGQGPAEGRKGGVGQRSAVGGAAEFGWTVCSKADSRLDSAETGFSSAPRRGGNWKLISKSQ